jgi:hypothetical protein
MNTKICSKCLVEKSYSEYYKNKSNNLGIESFCKDCSKIYRINNIDKRRSYEKDYRLKNKDKISARNKVYQSSEKSKSQNKSYKIKNKEKINKQNNSYRKLNRAKINQRRNSNIQQRIKHSLRARLWSAIRGNNKSLSTIELLGCDVEYLIKYIEDLFLESMSWSNYGEWHIDHIRPCASFDLTDIEQQKICFNYKNLQPLWAEDNIRKGCKVIGS